MSSMLDKFETVGIRLRQDITKEKRAELKSIEDAVDLLVEMGSGDGVEPLSDNIWHFDTECIYGEGDYTRIASCLSRLTGGRLPLDTIIDHIDPDIEEAWLSFTHQGNREKWTFKVEDDWVDTEIFIQFDKLFKTVHSELRFTYFDLGGQDCLIGCATAKQLDNIAQETGIRFNWLVTE